MYYSNAGRIKYGKALLKGGWRNAMKISISLIGDVVIEFHVAQPARASNHPSSVHIGSRYLILQSKFGPF